MKNKDATTFTPYGPETILCTLNTRGMIDRRAFIVRGCRWTGGLLLAACLGSLVSCVRDDDLALGEGKNASDYYLKQKDALLKQASEFSELLEQSMVPEYGSEKAAAIARDTVKTYDRMIDELPYIGGEKNAHMTELLISASTSMAFCLSMKEHGESIDDAGRINYDTIEKVYQANPIPADQKYQPGNVGEKRREAKEFAEWTQKREYPYDWVSEYVGGMHEPFIYGMNNIECGGLKLCEHYGIGEFTRYLCMLDNILYPARGQGLTRTKTLAEGFDLCDFRFREDGVVELEEPFTAKKFREWGK